MKNVIHIINNLYNDMQRAERAVAEYVLKRPDEVILLSMKALADKVNVSDNSVLRFCRTCGFSGYLDFKTALLPQIITQKGSIYQQVQMKDKFLLQKKKISENIQATIRETYDSIQEDDIATVAKIIAGSSNTVTVGLAGSAGVALIFSDSLLSMGISSTSFSDRIEIERYCSSLTKHSVLVGLTTSGETREVLMAIERARGNNAFTVLISNNLSVKKEVIADTYLFTQIPASNIAGYYFALPRIAQLSIVELILSKISAFIMEESKK